MSAADEFRAALEAGDFRQLRRISDVQEPHLSRLSDAQAEQVMHDARTRTKSIPLPKRLYSHRWLKERGFESGLPEELRPRWTEPVAAFAVGVALGTGNPLLKPALAIVRSEMEKTILEAHADGKLTDSDFIRARLLETKDRSMKQLFGALSIGGRNG